MFLNRKNVVFTEVEPFSNYCEQLKDICPYLIPSERSGLLFFEKWLPNSSLSNLQLQEELFYLAIELVEELRVERKKVQNGLLICHNIIFDNIADNQNGRSLLKWPHWILKSIYSRVGIMFGKFWFDERSTSRIGLEIPPPPCNFLSIRSAIVSKDPYFLDNTPSILQEMINSIDNGENVLSQFGLNEINIDAMKKINLFENAMNWSKHILEKEKLS